MEELFFVIGFLLGSLSRTIFRCLKQINPSGKEVTNVQP